MPSYDPFERGPLAVDARTFHAHDASRGRVFPCELWYPEAPGPYPLVVYSHHSGGTRRSATYLTTHLASHGYVVAALDHSETFAPELARKEDETSEELNARTNAMIASRVPDIRFLLDHVLNSEPRADGDRIGIVGHSFGGWTALAIPDVDDRVGAIVGLAPAGASNPRPGIIPAELSFAWRRDVPTLFLVAEDDVALPLSGMYELLDRTPAAKRMVVLRSADHAHFADNAESMHEAFRTMALTGAMTALAAMQKEMRPFADLCSAEQAHTFTRGLALGHLDAHLRHHEPARQFLASDLEAALAARNVPAFTTEPRASASGAVKEYT